MCLGTAAGARARARVRARTGHLNTVLLSVVEIRAALLDLRVPAVHVIQANAIFLGNLNTAITAAD